MLLPAPLTRNLKNLNPSQISKHLKYKSRDASHILRITHVCSVLLPNRTSYARQVWYELVSVHRISRESWVVIGIGSYQVVVFKSTMDLEAHFRILLMISAGR